MVSIYLPQSQEISLQFSIGENPNFSYPFPCSHDQSCMSAEVRGSVDRSAFHSAFSVCEVCYPRLSVIMALVKNAVGRIL